ncbi:hypothetical protein BC941DRAFT_409088 [Chlamydoabsidia padenii]|nr:hypothetical protein BC941DRAFT_409088 [Chlamydoabsidia padenii]
MVFGSHIYEILLLLLPTITFAIQWVNTNDNTTAKLQQPQILLPSCTTPINQQQRKPRIAVFSHNEANAASYFHHPEQGALDAATIVDVQIEWNRHLVTTGLKMSDDIKAAVDQVKKKKKA